MPVVDASVLVAYLTGGEPAEQARVRLLREPLDLWAPHLVDAEVGHAIRRAVSLGELRASAGRAALEDLAALPLRRAPHAALLAPAWRRRANLSFYDALYVALAERLETVLITLDGRLAAAPGLRSRVELIG